MAPFVLAHFDECDKRCRRYEYVLFFLSKHKNSAKVKCYNYEKICVVVVCGRQDKSIYMCIVLCFLCSYGWGCFFPFHAPHDTHHFRLYHRQFRWESNTGRQSSKPTPYHCDIPAMMIGNFSFCWSVLFWYACFMESIMWINWNVENSYFFSSILQILFIMSQFIVFHFVHVWQIEMRFVLK